MAFLDCRDGTHASAPPSLHTPSLHTARPEAAAPELRHRFTPHEQRVLALARLDGPETLLEPRQRGWLARFVLGPTPPSPRLANPRLEALRRLAVQAWDKGYLVPASALKDACKAGFSEDQVGALLDTIGRARSARQFAPV